MTIMVPPAHDKGETRMPEVLVLDANRYPLLTKHWPGVVDITEPLTADDNGAVTLTTGGQRK